jgi:hypothetical protein
MISERRRVIDFEEKRRSCFPALEVSGIGFSIQAFPNVLSREVRDLRCDAASLHYHTTAAFWGLLFLERFAILIFIILLFFFFTLRDKGFLLSMAITTILQ